ncbi:MAG: thioredoxin-disulfide reductase [Deltaproteobacteria bacterium]|nr:thioredoxin-disulfide reductase [Deltaproteobacteria bacterium]
MRDLIIIGSGPGGLTAAIYAARADLKPLVIEGLQPGGQLTITTEVENFPGFPEGIQGPELMDRMRQQAMKFGSEHLFEVVTKVDFTGRPFAVWTGDTKHEARSVIVSTGASARWLGVEGEKRLQGRGVSACATCDGFFFRDMKVAVVGGGDSAVEEATFLTRFAREVVLVHRRDELRASAVMRERAARDPKISFLWDSVPVEILGDDVVTGMKVRNVKSGEVSTVALDGVFMAIGHAPNTEVFAGQLDLDDKGYLKTERMTRTNVPGVFACGDVVDTRYRQAITAAGWGCMAALDAQHWLAEQKG